MRAVEVGAKIWIELSSALRFDNKARRGRGGWWGRVWFGRDRHTEAKQGWSQQAGMKCFCTYLMLMR